jgi:hypothetical protein
MNQSHIFVSIWPVLWLVLAIFGNRITWMGIGPYTCILRAPLGLFWWFPLQARNSCSKDFKNFQLPGAQGLTAVPLLSIRVLARIHAPVNLQSPT